MHHRVAAFLVLKILLPIDLVWAANHPTSSLHANGQGIQDQVIDGVWPLSAEDLEDTTLQAVSEDEDEEDEEEEEEEMQPLTSYQRQSQAGTVTAQRPTGLTEGESEIFAAKKKRVEELEREMKETGADKLNMKAVQMGALVGGGAGFIFGSVLIGAILTQVVGWTGALLSGPLPPELRDNNYAMPQANSTIMSIAVLALIGLLLGGGVTFVVLHARRRISTSAKQPLLTAC
eukprot:gnl/MRDRNA2_/MRDRNA2_79794_c0_seq2.p1 gnl/MRDRNA2_/MRDRNA2_79794_c0~~gnl/MRDRNA2_/MRDRNA2_79794_c0_seq2.p1  ORF type:complete len:232 (-),score=55.80 gnl/MRDRNA2_/MRDRNA2_79794_c0_seq2:70-765(-)